MQLFSLATAASVFASASAIAVNVTYDTRLDNSSLPLREVACWREGAGLPPYYDGEWTEWVLRGNLPPRIMAIQSIDGPDYPLCGSCWMLTYGDTARPVFAIDHADSGFVMELEGMDSLTGGKAKMLGTVTVNATQVELINCGLSYPDPVSDL